MVLNDEEIAALAHEGMIAPFTETQVRALESGTKAISYGLSSFGYDIRLNADTFRAFSPVQCTEIDPKDFSSDLLIDVPLHRSIQQGSWWVLPAHCYALGVTRERFDMPPDVIGISLGKSTYARCGTIVNVTPLEPSWRGHLVVEISNSADVPVRIYAEEGIAQIIFLRGNTPAISYSTRAGKYQDQLGLTVARL